MPKSDFIPKRVSGGSSGANIDCPFKLTIFTGTVDDPVPPGQIAYKIGPGLANNVLITDGTTADDPDLIYFINIGDTTTMLVLQVDTTDVAVTGGQVFYGSPGDPPSPQEDFPPTTIFIPLYVFNSAGNAVRVIGCNNVMVYSYVAFTQNNDMQTGINDYPYTNFWNWGIFS